jgi:hypothetical protein
VSRLIQKNASRSNITLLRCEPETLLPPASIPKENIVKYPPDGPDRLDDSVYLSYWKSDGESAPPSVIQDPNQVPSTSRTCGESWQGKFDSLQTALQSNSQQARWSSPATSSEGQDEHDHAVTYNSTSKYQGWPSPDVYHAGQRTSSSVTSDNYFALCQVRDDERVRSSYHDFGTRETSNGGSSETRHVGEDPVWLSATRTSQIISRQSADSRPPMHDFYPLIHHLGGGNASLSNESALFEALQSYFARASESAGQNPYGVIQDSPSYTTSPREENDQWER